LIINLLGELAEMCEKELNQIIDKAIDQELKSKNYNLVKIHNRLFPERTTNTLKKYCIQL